MESAGSSDMSPIQYVWLIVKCKALESWIPTSSKNGKTSPCHSNWPPQFPNIQRLLSKEEVVQQSGNHDSVPTCFKLFILNEDILFRHIEASYFVTIYILDSVPTFWGTRLYMKSPKSVSHSQNTNSKSSKSPTDTQSSEIWKLPRGYPTLFGNRGEAPNRHSNNVHHMSGDNDSRPESKSELRNHDGSLLWSNDRGLYQPHGAFSSQKTLNWKPSIYTLSYPESPRRKNTALWSCDLLTRWDLHQVNKVRIITLRIDHELYDANGKYVNCTAMCNPHTTCCR